MDRPGARSFEEGGRTEGRGRRPPAVDGMGAVTSASIRCSNGYDVMSAWFWHKLARAAFWAGFALCAVAAWAQSPLPGVGTRIQLNGSDLAVLEAQEVRKDLACSVDPVKPTLGFDLRFHGGYEINLPLRDVAGNENLLSILVRVTSEVRKDDPVYFVQRISVPKLPDDAKGDAVLGGLFDL